MATNNNITDLIEISQYYGKDTRYVIAGGGNTSYKDEDTIWVKGSGYALGTINEDGFAVLDRKKLAVISEKTYSEDPTIREEEVKNDLAAACLTKDCRPSVETSIHNALQARFVVHLHPTTVNGLLCSQHAEAETQRLFGDEVVYIPYTNPGYTLYKEVETRIEAYRSRFGKDLSVLLLQNHGIFVGADTTDEIKRIYENLIFTIEHARKNNVEGDVIVSPYSALNVGEKRIKTNNKIASYLAMTDDVPRNDDYKEMNIPDIIPAIRMMLSRDSLKTLKIRNNSRIAHFASSETAFAAIARPFTPDCIVYCKSAYIYLSCENNEDLLTKAETAINAYILKWGFAPKVLLIKYIGLVAVGDNAAECDTILDIYEDMMKIAETARSFGGEHPMTQSQIDFIDNWEVESYRRKVSRRPSAGRVENKTIIVTGAAQGFGEGIAKCLINEGANIVVADVNETAGKATAEILSGIAKGNRAVFVQTDVADPQSLHHLMHETVCQFGGVDVFISNAGVLRAGGLDDMTSENFDFVTKINYNAFFYCTQAVARVMKLQNRYTPTNYGDIIQINSKSGLRGSKANFAYAGGKFGGIGLTQSFALELAPYRIKVNAICPGNFYEGPLWADPENGLFVQYLRAGKVPGAKNIDDVRAFYMNQVPMRKGTSPEDVTKAILYLIEQTCETGQAVPVTGGQVMLG